MNIERWEVEGTSLAIYFWSQVAEPIGIVQLIHGMGEHLGRYDHFARFLNSEGFLVFGNDHRGHGKTVLHDEEKGYFSEEEGWSSALSDTLSVACAFNKRYNKLPLFVLGHSMGSVILRCYLEKFHAAKKLPPYKKAVLSGVPSADAISASALVQLAKFSIATGGKKGYSSLLEFLFRFGRNKKTEKRTASDWLTTDQAQVDKFINDPLCNPRHPNIFYFDFGEGIKRQNQKEHFSLFPKKIPLLFIAGTEDPVGSYGTGVAKTETRYKKSGVTTEITLFEKMRHECLNEVNRNLAYRRIIDFLNY